MAYDRERHRDPLPGTTDPPLTLIVSAGWTLVVLVLSAFDMGSLLSRIYYWIFPDSMVAATMSGMMWMGAVVTAPISLILFIPVWKLSNDPPPGWLVWFSLFAAFVPLALAVWVSWF